MSQHTSREDALSARDFTRLRELVYQQAGICLGPEKKIMVEVRLKRRLRALALERYADYCEFAFSSRGMKEELIPLIDVITTNKTDFFREPAHFDQLVRIVLPALGNRSSTLVAWSAACSTGEEPYTLAMVLSDYAAAHPAFRFRILATDISTVVLDRAQKAIYAAESTKPIPAALRHKYLLRSRTRGDDRVRVVPELRRLVEFRRLNFMDSDYAVEERAAIIFCRNVLIYFDRPTQEAILRKLLRHLEPGGYLFSGHSETLHDMDLPLTAVAPALYRKVDTRSTHDGARS